MSEPYQKPDITKDDITDALIFVKINGNYYGLVPKEEPEEAKQMRISFAKVLLNSHYVIDKPTVLL